MSYRTTITLDHEAHSFLQQFAGSNKSAFINDLLIQQRQKTLKERIAAANREEAEDLLYQSELSEWDETLADGLSD